MAKTIGAQFHRGDPFENFDAESVEPDFWGWGSNDPVFDALINITRPNLIVEIGTWLGGSAVNMANICRHLDLDAEILCVDTWLGAPEHVKNEAFHKALRFKNGYPSIYYTFLRNIVDRNVQDLITPIPMPSGQAITLLQAFGAKADLIYVDGAHQYEPVKQDIADYYPMLAPNGLLFGDDFAWEGVEKAAREYAHQNNLELFVFGTKWVLAASNSIHKPVLESLKDNGIKLQLDRCAAAVAATPENDDALANYATALESHGEFEKASEYFGKTVELHPENTKYLKGYGRTLVKAGKLSQAEGHLKKAIELGEPTAEVTVQYLNALEGQEKFDEALKHAEYVAGIGSNYNAAVRGRHCWLLKQRGRQDEAVELWQVVKKSKFANSPKGKKLAREFG